MAKTIYKKKIKNDKEYYFYRLRHNNLKSPRDIYSLTVKGLESKIKTITNELDHGIANNKECFETFLCDWLFDVHFINIKPSTKERYEGIYRNYIKNSMLSRIKIKDLTSKDIQNYYNDLIKKGKTVNSIINLNKIIAPCVRYAYNNDKIIKDFSKSVVLPKEDEEKKLNKIDDVQPFTLDEQKKFIAAIEGHDLEVLLITALNTGLRQGELLALTWDDIDVDNNTIIVNKAVKYISDVSKEGRGKYKITIQTPKSEASNRTVSIPELLTTRLKKFHLEQKELRLKMANLYIDNKLVFCNIYGGYLDNNNVRKRYKRILVNNKIRDRKFHDLRHTYATRLFELNEQPKTVQSLLGHSNISITLDTYTHVLESMKVKAATKLNDLYSYIGAK
ncbi:MAG TPA: site-specific integrase [Clostridium sp.]|uniref:tyrosine-type recombinase/integrase n=1 Tax=Clostridium sp. TaxID=1506 RepID=UPI002F953DBE